jgi:class 3 adenylate cyclase
MRERIEELEAQLRRNRHALERYFPAEVAQKILSDEAVCDLTGGHIPATVLFFDLRGSTMIAEGLEPYLFSEFLSQIFTDIMDLIYGNGGSVNKMLGDGIMATFGPPVPQEDDACRAVKSAAEIMEYLHTFNDVRPDYLEHPVKAGIGIASGNVFAGYIGSVRRMEYTVLGDAVNIAARLEGATKELGTPVVLDETTARLAGETLPLATLGSLPIRGRNEPITVYGLAHLKQ